MIQIREPKLRFKADDGSEFLEWEEKRLGEVCEYGKRHGTGQNYVGTENMFSAFGGVIIENTESECNGILYSSGDILMSNIRPYLKKVWLADREGVCSTDVLVFRPIKIESEYLYSLIASDFFITKVMSAAKGSKMPRGDKKHIMEIPVSVPSIPEQRKIASFLSTIDEIIQSTESELTAWQERKKGVMQKIFNREVRFKADDGSEFPEWEEKKLGELGEFIGGGTPSTKVKEYWKGTTPWVSSSDVSENDIRQLSASRFITEEAIEKSATKRIPENSICIVCRVGVGKVVITPFELCTSQDFVSITALKDDICFLGYAIWNLMQRKISDVRGTSIKGIPVKDLREYMIDVPFLLEQQKIADCLSSLDDAINQIKAELSAWKEFKKGLLQQMFV